MNKKIIKFGRIGVNLNNEKVEELHPNEKLQETEVGASLGFGKFGHKIKDGQGPSDKRDDDQSTNEEARRMEALARVEKIAQEAAELARAATKLRLAQVQDDTKQQDNTTAGSPNEQGDSCDRPPAPKEQLSDEEEIVGPPIPSNLQQEDDTDEIGPPVPPNIQHKDGGGEEPSKQQKTDKISSKSSEDSYDELSDSDNDDQESGGALGLVVSGRAVRLTEAGGAGSAAVSALAVDAAGARLAAGYLDYHLTFWDFAGMDSRLLSFRRVQPCEGYPVLGLHYTATGDHLLLVTHQNAAKILDREGVEVAECARGDRYIADVGRTRGHTGALTGAAPHPRTAHAWATCALDGTLRTWALDTCTAAHAQLYRVRTRVGLRTHATAIVYAPPHSPAQSLLAAGCADGALRLWDERRPPLAPALQRLDAAAQPPTAVVFSHLGHQLAVRALDNTLKVWDVRGLAKGPVAALPPDLPLDTRSERANCAWSGDDSLVVAGSSSGQLVAYRAAGAELQQAGTRALGEAAVLRVEWHARLQQVLTGGADGAVRCLWAEGTGSTRGAAGCVARASRRRAGGGGVVRSQHVHVVTPHALPMFRTEGGAGSGGGGARRRAERARQDPVASRRPELPLGGSGAGGRVVAGGGTLSSYVIRQLGLSKRVEDDRDPREAILAHAAAAAESPYWVAPAYSRTQPTPIFRTEPEDAPPAPPAPGAPDAKRPRL